MSNLRDKINELRGYIEDNLLVEKKDGSSTEGDVDISIDYCIEIIEKLYIVEANNSEIECIIGELEKSSYHSQLVDDLKGAQLVIKEIVY